MFPLHTVLPSSRAWYDATIGGQPVVDADIRPVGLDYTASVSTEDNRFQRFCRNSVEAQRFILSKLDGYEIQLTELQQQAVDLVAKYGPFVNIKERRAIEAHTAVEYWDDTYSGKKLQAAVTSVLKRANEVFHEARAEYYAPGAIVHEAQLSDSDVVAGIRYLTAQDSDRASKANGVGWSRSVSGLGHWANVTLDIEPEVAIHVVRKFIGGYTRQLREGGII